MGGKWQLEVLREGPATYEAKGTNISHFCLLLINNQVMEKGKMLSLVYFLLNWGIKVLWANLILTISI